MKRIIIFITQKQIPHRAIHHKAPRAAVGLITYYTHF
jgi:hypothetical protein